MIKKCKRCGIKFIAKFPDQVTHSGKCIKKKKITISSSNTSSNIKTVKLKKKEEKVIPKYVPLKRGYSKTPQSRDRHYRQKYGITLDDYNKMLENQGGRCAICGSISGALFVDHCHKTGRVRGLLCCSCNTGIGLLKDNIDVLTNAIKYLSNGN